MVFLLHMDDIQAHADYTRSERYSERFRDEGPGTGVLVQLIIKVYSWCYSDDKANQVAVGNVIVESHNIRVQVRHVYRYLYRHSEVLTQDRVGDHVVGVGRRTRDLRCLVTISTSPFHSSSFPNKASVSMYITSRYICRFRRSSAHT